MSLCSSHELSFCLLSHRRPVLVDKVKVRLEDKGESEGDGCEIIELKIMSYHVHLFISAKPILAPNQIVFHIKGYTSRKIREEFEQRKSLPSLWTRSYFVSTAGNVSSDVIQI